MQIQSESRSYGYDNIKFILITCVVFAHILEGCKNFSVRVFIYGAIYSFHMPAFIFVSGYFAQFKRRKIICSFAIPYVLLQIAYCLFEKWLHDGEMSIQFTTPYWLLWYLLAMMFYQLLIPFYDTEEPYKRGIILASTVILAIAVGYDNTIGYSMTLSRFFVFQPWFVLGYYFRKKCKGNALKPIGKAKMRRVIEALLGAAILVMILYVLSGYRFDKTIFYGSFPYEAKNYGPVLRIILMVIAFMWIYYFINIIKPLIEFRIPMISTIGRNTLPIFLIHGFVVKYIQQHHKEWLSHPVNAVVITAMIIVLLGNPLIAKLIQFLFTDRWYSELERTIQK